MMTRTPLLALTILSTLLIGSAVSEARTWTQASSGKTIEADFVRLEGDLVVLSRNGQLAKVPLKQLSQEDQDFVAEMKKGDGAEDGASSKPVNNGTDWPQWRGADRSDIAPGDGIMDKWPADGPKQLWVYSDAGMGYSSFSVVGGKLFTMGTREQDLCVICVNTEDGKEVWSTKIGEDDEKGYNAGWGNGPRSTPTFSDGMIYALGPKGTLACLSAEDGKEKWSKNLESDFGGKPGGWGFAESPLIDGDKVVMAPGGKDAGIVALNKETGATIWKADDVTPGNAEYASIIPTEMNGKRQYVRLFAQELVSVDAETGDVLWKSEWPGKTAVIPTPIVDGNQVYVTSGYGVGCKLVEIGEDNLAKDLWENKEMKNHHGGVVKIGDHVYGFSDGGGLICQDWTSGDMVWNEKGAGKLIKGATIGVGDQLICLNEDDGTVSLVDATPKGFELHGQFEISPKSENRNPKGKIWTHPVVVDGKLFLRDQEHIVAYDVKG
ncbi:MAG: PQQ-binding-like beta-propeller repeat protein [Verrucomicrobiae bacterium]|nr:PQQ-binding-like beta-propeller repeat protein [Verrucomicrobiae bacterium]